MRSVQCDWCGNTYWWFEQGQAALPGTGGVSSLGESVCSVCGARNRHVPDGRDNVIISGVILTQNVIPGRPEFQRSAPERPGTTGDAAVGALLGLLLGAAGLAYLLSRGRK